MAKIKNKTHDQYHIQSKTSTSSSSFLCCFGFSGRSNFPEKESERDMIKISQSSDHDDDYKKKKKKKVMVRFSWPKLRLKSSSGVKTVPVLDTTVSEKPPKDGKVYWPTKPKSKSNTNPDKIPSKRHAPTTNSKPPNDIEIVVPVAPYPTPKQKPRETKYESVQNINLENRKNLSPLHSFKDNTALAQRRLSFTRKIDSIRAACSSQPSSPVQAKPKPSGRAIRHSDSFVAGPNRDKGQVAPTKTERWRAEPAFGKRFEPIVGMSVVMVMLVIMVMCGRLCAILCTSAWLYFVPRLSSPVDCGGIMGRSKDLDLGSEECKKKVVFEGFLERNNHRITP